jgi:prepilin-type N-terminal cleavage/methylation domain-containing protein
MKRFLSYRQRGLSLVELAVAMVIIGILGVIVWRWVMATREPLQRPAMLAQLSQAQAAVEGFVLANSRLPCPAADAGGVAACGDASAVFLPWRTLGMGSEFNNIHYGVNRGGSLDLTVDTAVAAPMVSPDLFLDLPGIAVPEHTDDSGEATSEAKAAANAAIAAIAASHGRRTVVNGLDWCHVLRRYAANPVVTGVAPTAANPAAVGVLVAGSAADSVPVAYILVHPGANNQFDGHNAVGASSVWKFDFPGRSQSSDFDDLSLAVGPADLSARIGCVARLSGMQAAAQGAYAAYDTVRVMQEYWSLRVYDVTAKVSAVSSAETGVVLAAMGIALGTSGTVFSIASSANTEGVTAFEIAIAAVNLGMAIAENVIAKEDLDEAKAELVAAKAKRLAADAYAVRIYNSFTQAMNAAIQLDQKGLNP